MNAQLSAIAKRRALLVTRAAVQRSLLRSRLRPWRTPLAFLDRGRIWVRRLRAHPLAMTMGMLLMLSRRRGRWSVWAGRLWAGWQLYQSFYGRPARTGAADKRSSR